MSLHSLFFFAVIVIQWFLAVSAFVPNLILKTDLRHRNGNPPAWRNHPLFGVQTLDGPFSPSAFALVWGREPLLVRNAFNSTELLESTFWPSWENVMELASDVDAASRLLRHDAGQFESFTMDLGPFAEDDLKRLSLQANEGFRWTIVVNDVDRFYTPLTDWMDDNFGFLPRWRRDDGQISLAGKGGGIGPHVDNYDVFLIQTSGVRLWEIGNEKMSVEEEMKTMIPGLDVRILQRDVWKAQDITSFELRPGDLLYLPPRTIHCGTAVSDHCMTLSVGCRTPAASELTSRVVELLSSSVADYAVQRYVDHDLLIKDASNGLLSKQVRDRMKQLVLDAVHRVVDDDLIFDEIVGRLVTEPKRFRENYPITWEAMGSDCPWDSPRHALEAARQGTGCFFRAEGISFAFSKIESTIAMTTTFRLYADGEVFELEQQSQDEGELATRLLAAICTSPFDLDRAILDHLPLQGESLLEKLLVKGYLYVAPEDDEDYDDDEEEDS